MQFIDLVYAIGFREAENPLIFQSMNLDAFMSQHSVEVLEVPWKVTDARSPFEGQGGWKQQPSRRHT